MLKEKGGRSSAAQRGKGVTKQYVTRKVEKHSNRGRKGKGC